MWRQHGHIWGNWAKPSYCLEPLLLVQWKFYIPLLLTKLFLWDCNHSSSQLKNHQGVRRTLEGQTEWLALGSVRRASPTAVRHTCGPDRWDGAVGSRASPPHWGAAPHLCLRGCNHACAWPGISWSPTQGPDSTSTCPAIRTCSARLALISATELGWLGSCGSWHCRAWGQLSHCTLTVTRTY